MNQEYIDPDTNNPICEAFGCSARAVEEIKASVGQQGFITLMVCSKCKRKFVTHETAYLPA